mmetsp:Transcript_11379/g.28133  ORF Transcript_11379/g.28133 Transcript_11379/m.28133 type:complete len:206 (-) Transcript_11379:392-1009(-)
MYTWRARHGLAATRRRRRPLPRPALHNNAGHRMGQRSRSRRRPFHPAQLYRLLRRPGSRLPLRKPSLICRAPLSSLTFFSRLSPYSIITQRTDLRLTQLISEMRIYHSTTHLAHTLLNADRRTSRLIPTALTPKGMVGMLYQVPQQLVCWRVPMRMSALGQRSSISDSSAHYSAAAARYVHFLASSSRPDFVSNLQPCCRCACSG